MQAYLLHELQAQRYAQHNFLKATLNKHQFSMDETPTSTFN